MTRNKRIGIAFASSGVVLLLIAVVAASWHQSWSMRQADHAVVTGRWQKAEAALNRVLLLQPHRADANILMAKVATSQNKWKQALKYLGRVEPSQERAPEAQVRAAEVLLLGLKRADQAEQKLKATLDQFPDTVDAYKLLLFLYRIQGREEEARDLVWTAYDILKPGNRAGVLSTWFLLQYAQVKQTTAISILAEYLKADPEDLNSRIAVALVMYRAGKTNDALKQLEELDLGPEHLQGRAVLIDCYLDTGQPKKAERLLSEWPEDSSDSRYWRLQGIYQQTYAGDFEAAADAYTKAIEDRAYDFEMFYRLSLCLRGLGKTDLADKMQKESERLKWYATRPVIQELIDNVVPNIDTVQSRYQMANFFENTNSPREAKSWYEEALALNNQHAESLAGLKRLKQGESSFDSLMLALADGR